MYLYFALFILVLTLALLSMKYKIPKAVFYIEFTILSVVLCFRYGQGSDYFSYQYIFSCFNSFDEAISNVHNIHSELLFRLLCALFDNFEWFVFIVSIYEIIMLGFFFGFHPYLNRCFSMLLLFHTIYLTYFFSAMRQGIVISTFLGLGVLLIERKKWNVFIPICLLLSLIHSVALVWILIPLASRFNIDLMMKKLLPISIVLGLLMSTGIFRSVILSIPIVGAYLFTYLDVGISYFSYLERFISLLLIMILYKTQSSLTNIEVVLIKTYVYGCLLFFITAPYSLLSARIIICFKALEVFLVPMLLSRGSRYRQLITIYFIAMPVVMYFHNVSGYIYQGHYNNDITIVNYPYISILNKDEIWDYRSMNYYYDFIN